MKWKWLIQEYFVFSRKERLAILTLLFLLLLAIIVPYHCSRPIPGWQADTDTAWMTALAALESHTVSQDSFSHSPYKDRSDPAPRSNSLKNLVSFDPNILPESGWLSFGLKPRTVSTIIKFREKGGRFRKPEDILRIYGLHPEQAAQLISYVQIPASKTVSPPSAKHLQKSSSTFPPSPSTLLDINQADSTAWEALPGIGPKLASRIIKFRDALGGFYQVSQVAEVFGLPDSTYRRILPKLVCIPGQQIRLSVNESSIEALGKHPYIRRSLASRIIAYRNAHGIFAELQQLLRIHTLDSLTYSRIAPYIRL